MLLRRALSLMLLACFAGVSAAQVTLDRDNLPFSVGARAYKAFVLDNADGSQTAAIEALIAQSGGNATYDFATLQYEFELTSSHEFAIGAVGPGAELDLLGGATHTAIFPFRSVEDTLVLEGTLHSYAILSDDHMLDLGGHLVGEYGGMDAEVVTTRTPGGDTTAVFPYTMGDDWTSTFTEEVDFSGFALSTDVTKAYVVDSWGTLTGPGVEGGVPALRVRVATTRVTFGFPFTEVCYEYRSTAPVHAEVCEGGFVSVPTAQFTVLGAEATASEAEPSLVAAVLDPVFPNPAGDEVHVTYRLERPGRADLKVYDLLGRVVHEVEGMPHRADGHATAIDVSGLAPGVYVVRLMVEGRSWARPFTVVR